MMNATHGMDVAEVEDLGRFLLQRADRLRQITAEINRAVYSVHWQGGVALQFGQQHWPGHRARLQAVADQLQGLGRSALNNAAAQVQVSAAGPQTASPGGIWSHGAVGVAGLAASGTTLGMALRSTSGVTSLGSAIASTISDAKHMPFAGHVGNVASGVGAFVDGFTIGEELADGHYRDAALDAGLTAGDLGADFLKAGHTPVSYGAGVALQTWVEVAREARNVDWSADGLRAIQQASLSDWTGALGEAATRMPSKLVSIFGL